MVLESVMAHKECGQGSTAPHRAHTHAHLELVTSTARGLEHCDCHLALTANCLHRDQGHKGGGGPLRMVRVKLLQGRAAAAS